MAKYNGCLTTEQVAELESKAADRIMKRYKVPLDARREITSIIQEAYFQLSQSSEFHKKFMQYLKEEKNIDCDSSEIIKGFFRWETKQMMKNQRK